MPLNIALAEEIKRLNGETSRLLNRKLELEADVRNLNYLIGGLQSEIRNLREEVDDLRKENLSLQEELEERDHYDELEYERWLYDREEGWDD